MEHVRHIAGVPLKDAWFIEVEYVTKEVRRVGNLTRVPFARYDHTSPMLHHYYQRSASRIVSFLATNTVAESILISLTGDMWSISGRGQQTVSMGGAKARIPIQ